MLEDPISRRPGQHARDIVRRLRMRALLTLGALAVATTLLGRGFGFQSPIFMGSEVALLTSILAISRFMLPVVDRHDRGATGEEHVGGLLESLAQSGWHVIHDASFGRGNVDHLVIGPGGVFTIETKSNPNPVRVGRLHGALLRQAQAQRSLVEQLTGEPVEPLIVFSRAWVDRPLARRKGVRVMPARMLIEYLSSRRRRLDSEQAQRALARVGEALAATASAGSDSVEVRPWRSHHSGRPLRRRQASLIERGSRWRRLPWA